MTKAPLDAVILWRHVRKNYLFVVFTIVDKKQFFLHQFFSDSFLNIVRHAFFASKILLFFSTLKLPSAILFLSRQFLSYRIKGSTHWQLRLRWREIMYKSKHWESISSCLRPLTNGYNISIQQRSTLLNSTCYTRLATMWNDVEWRWMMLEGVEGKLIVIVC